MNTFYTSEKHVQLLIALMKEHGIKKIVASPGTTNMCLIASVQQDDYFEIISSVDERSAAYIACGLSEETGEPVALSCTGATASRNYMSGLTEAYYRKLPVLAITSTQHKGRIGQNMPQVIDRSALPKDIAKHSVYIAPIHVKEDEWACEVAINNALLELRRNGNGPVHINLETTYSKDYTVKELPKVRVIDRITYEDKIPRLDNKKIGIFVGPHSKWSEELTSLVDTFCEKYNAVVFCDHTSNYKGKFRVFSAILATQKLYSSPCCNMDVLIDIGNVSGSGFVFRPKEVWRVNPDGEIRDTRKRIKYIFDMEEKVFFEKYVKLDCANNNNKRYIEECLEECERLRDKIPELPFSNPWIAKNTASILPQNSVLHLGILNTLRSWNYFDVDRTILEYCNTGGFGIDGCVSSLIGASLADSNKLYFGIVGDLAFFYDMNVIGNRMVGNNVRLMVINNGRGTEFRNEIHLAAQFKEDADPYIAAAGHFGNQSSELIKNYVTDLGYDYICAHNKDEYKKNVETFVNPKIGDKSIVFEVFTDYQDESDAVSIMCNLESSITGSAKQIAKNMLGEKGIKQVKKLLKR